MKKMHPGTRKLTLKKEVISSLRRESMSAVRGGELIIADRIVVDFPSDDPPAVTYSLSWGARCARSKHFGADNPYDCGAETIKH